MTLDPLTGQYYDEARWYDPGLSVFDTRDPAESDANLYCYCCNDPSIMFDPSGLRAEQHHWFPQSNGRGQAEVDAKCGEGFINIHDYTTALDEAAHHYLHDVFQYQKYAESFIVGACTCCQVLLEIQALRQISYLLLQQQNLPLPATWSLHTYGQNNSTDALLAANTRKRARTNQSRRSPNSGPIT